MAKLQFQFQRNTEKGKLIMAKFPQQLQQKYRKRNIEYGKIYIAIATKILKRKIEYGKIYIAIATFVAIATKIPNKENCNCNKNFHSRKIDMPKFRLQLQQKSPQKEN